MANKLNSLSLPTHFYCVGMVSVGTRFKQVSPIEQQCQIIDLALRSGQEEDGFSWTKAGSA